MKQNYRVFGKDILAVILLLAVSQGAGWCASDQDKPEKAVYFSQGQSAYDSLNISKTQQDAVQDLLAQAIVQAIGASMSPAQMGSQYAVLQDKILKNAGNYVETYQVFSEVPVNGLYQIRGQVTINMGLLKKELGALGLLQDAQRMPPPTSTVEQAGPAPGPSSGHQPEVSKRVGEWTLVIHSDHLFASWQSLEKVLHERFPSMRVVRFVMDQSSARVELDGIDGESITSLDGTKLSNGVQLRVDSRSQETRTLNISFAKPAGQ